MIKTYSIFIAVIIFLIGLFLYQRNNTLEYKNKYENQIKETNRFKQNLKASEDSLKIIKDSENNLIAEILSYKFTVDEIENDYKDLFELYKSEKNKKPIYITETKYIIHDNITKIPTFLEGDSIIKIFDSINYGNNNWRLIKAEIPYELIYKIKEDSINNFALNKALNYSFYLQQKNKIDSKVLVFSGNEEILYKDINNYDSINFRIQIYESVNDLNLDSISNIVNLEKNEIYKMFDNNKFKYLTGIFTPKKNITPVIDVNDINVFSTLNTLNTNLDLKISMNLLTSIYEDTETGEFKVQVKTGYPNISFNYLKGAEIIPIIKENKKLTNRLKKNWGLGMNIGYGGIISTDNNNIFIKTGPVITIGVNYTPKWLQF